MLLFGVDQNFETMTSFRFGQDFGTFWPLEEEELTGASYVVRYMSESADCSDTYKSSWIIRSFLMESTEVRPVSWVGDCLATQELGRGINSCLIHE